MIVCLCHNVSDREIAREARACGSFDALQDRLLVGTACGSCMDCARDTFHEHRTRCAGHAERNGLTLAPAL